MDISQTDFQAHFLEDEDAVIRVSTAVFEDFHQSFSNGEYSLMHMLNECRGTLESGVTALRQIANGIRHKNMQLTRTANVLAFEHDLFKLLCDSDDLDKQVEASPYLPSHLHKILKDDKEFRQIYGLIKWCEYRSSDCPKGFTSILGRSVDVNLEKIRADLRSWTATKDLDLIFSDKNPLRGQFEQSAVLLYQLMIGFIRAGRVSLAVEEAEKAGCHNIAALVDTRSVLYELELSTEDADHQDFGFVEVRKAMKLAAQGLLSNTEVSTREEQRLFWAILAMDQRELLSRANHQEDRLWVLLNCALEKIFEDKTDNEFSIGLKKHQGNALNNVKEIFEALIGDDEEGGSETDVEFKIIAYIALEDSENLSAVLRQELVKDLEMHTTRFYAHLVLLMLAKEKPLDQDVADTVLIKFVDVLSQLGLIKLCPFYLGYCTRKLAEERLLKLLRTIQNDEERESVLAHAEQYQFSPSALCTSIYSQAKQVVRSAEGSRLDQALLEASRAWNWLGLCGELAIEALLEANFLYRKMFVHGRRAAAFDFFQAVPADLAELAEKYYQEQQEGVGDAEAELPFYLKKATTEYEGYQRYFHVIELYNQWEQTARKPPPPLPSEIPDEKWARLDLRRRTEFEITVNEARQARERYENILEQQKASVVELTEELLKNAESWLWLADEESLDEIEPDRGVLERNEEIRKIRSKYLFEVITALINVHRTSKDEMSVLNVARLIVDPKFEIYTLLPKSDLRKILQNISKSGAALLH